MSSVSVTTDRAQIKRKIQAATDNMLPKLAEVILADCNEFVREDQGTLKDSSYNETASDGQNIGWDTPYARRVFYTGSPSKDVNPNASLEWAEKARAKYKKDWEKLAQKKFDGEL